MPRIKVKDLNVDLAEVMKKDPKILHKIRGGAAPPNVAKMMLEISAAVSAGASVYSKTCPGPDTMLCCTGADSGCGAGPDTMGCNTRSECYFTY